jgi:serine/threonine-protein kinase
MGEVYRARDTRLDRDVAIKVSAIEFSERFTREARSIAALNHPNVCHLYDVGPDYLVLEYVEGRNLAGPMAFDEALPIVRQLIDGIEAAHEKNIIHRDLKTANIRITPDGVVKILDFGLAKAAEPESTADPTNSPTFTMGSTQVGVILGTAAFMAPEQAKGRAADRRSDIWSFGVVVYELLAGQTPFGGDSTVEVLGAVMNQEPDWSRVPPKAERLLRWCLQKDRRRRLAAIGDARMLLEESLTASPSSAVVATKRRFVWPMAAAALLLAAMAAYGWWSATRPVERPLTRLSVDLGPQAIRGTRITAVLSPDGSRLAFVGRGAIDGLLRMYVRRLDELIATPLTGTNYGALEMPFFSPNGDWIGYFGNGRLVKVPVQGGLPMELGGLRGNAGADWEDEDNIVIGSLTGLMQMPANGGTARPITKTNRPEAFPDVLPNGRGILFNTSERGVTTLEDLDINVLDVGTGTAKTLIKGGYWPRYLATSGKGGHLVFIRNGRLFGVAFDPVRLEITGSPAPLIDEVAASASISAGGGQFSSSSTGTFVYLSGSVENRVYEIQWLDPTGKTTTVMPPNAYTAPRLSPDGTRLAYTMITASGADVWVYDIGRDTSAQITFTGPGPIELAWAPDSKHLVFADSTGLWWAAADASRQPVRLLEDALPRPTSIAGDGRLAYARSSAENGLPDVWTLPLDLSDPDRPKPGKAEPFLTEGIAEVDPVFSPDGKLIAYASSESGREEVFVRPFPGPGGKWKVSSSGGKFPAWSRTTRELFFLGGDDRIMVASYTGGGDSFNAGRPRVWSPTPVRRDGVRQSFDISSDGRRAIVFPSPAQGQTSGTLHATFLLNFFDEVRRRIPGP